MIAKVTYWLHFLLNAYERDTTLATEIQRTLGFIPTKTVPRLRLAVNEESQTRYTQQATIGAQAP